MEGFESSYGLELLMVVHWVTQENLQVATNVEIVLTKAQSWSQDQLTGLKPQHIRKVWQCLHEQNWLLAAEPA